MINTYTGKCYCGQVQVSVTGEPRMLGLCHCTSCRAWHGAPFTAFAGMPSDAVEITGETTRADHREESGRLSCAVCGGAVANVKPAWDVTVIYASVVKELPFKPTLHLHYGERVMDIADGLPKFVNGPEQIGGTGTMAEEPELTRYLVE